ncbi:MAG TPA: hypothetical protein VGH77_13825 [Streptosporangiaceae bacterium]|jgi:hypothetical protein
MCSMPDPRLALIGTAIDELAEDAAGEGMDTLAGRVAALWAMVAAIDPELAQRLPGYRA